MADGSSARSGGRWKTRLWRVCDRSVAELGLDHASIGIATGARAWEAGAATSEVASELEEYAFTVGEGPCFEALEDHAPIVAVDLETQDAAQRWPAWTDVAARLGIRSATALPIEAGAITAGVLSAYSSSEWQATPRRMDIARSLVDAALVVLLDMALSLADPAEADELAEDGRPGDLSVLLRGDVHRAAGMVMVQADVSIDQALARLRAYAFATARPLPDVAADVLSRRIRFDADRGAAQ